LNSGRRENPSGLFSQYCIKEFPMTADPASGKTILTGPISSNAVVRVPGSKSYTHRMLIAAALSNGTSRVCNPLRSEDTLLTLNALRQMGIQAEEDKDAVTLQGGNGRLGPCAPPIYLANAGTAMRLLAGVAILGTGPYTLTGSPRMCQRPIEALLHSLNLLGVPARARNNDGCPPVIIEGGVSRGGTTAIDCSVSSQYLSGLLLAAPCLPEGLVVEVTQGPVSTPYIDLTVDILRTFGIEIRRQGYTHFEVPGGQTYAPGTYTVEADGSQAGYFWAAAAITGKKIKVHGVTGASRQGDVKLADLFGRMGCAVEKAADGITITGGALNAIEVDMGDMPDMVPTLAVAAAFAEGTTIITNVAHLRAKESDRLDAVARELSKMGITVQAGEDSLHITGGAPRGARIETYNDHRIAMSFAVAGLRAPGVVILDPDCVGKSFPTFWDVFEGLYR
jgi:3-phosphoshikimate 1-carboxyvinyltransferase